MSFAFRPNTVFARQLHQITKKFPKSKTSLDEAVENICQNPLVGDRIPGFGDSFHLRKVRFGLKEYKIGDRGGVRVVFLVHEEKKLVVPISCYKKGTYKRESEKINAVRRALKETLEEMGG